MLDFDKIPERVIDDLSERGWSDSDIEKMSPEQAFSEFCNWNGLINWGPSLWGVVKDLEKAETHK